MGMIISKDLHLLWKFDQDWTVKILTCLKFLNVGQSFLNAFVKYWLFCIQVLHPWKVICIKDDKAGWLDSCSVYQVCKSLNLIELVQMLVVIFICCKYCKKERVFKVLQQLRWKEGYKNLLSSSAFWSST